MEVLSYLFQPFSHTQMEHASSDRTTGLQSIGLLALLPELQPANINVQFVSASSFVFSLVRFCIFTFTISTRNRRLAQISRIEVSLLRLLTRLGFEVEQKYAAGVK